MQKFFRSVRTAMKRPFCISMALILSMGWVMLAYAGSQATSGQGTQAEQNKQGQAGQQGGLAAPSAQTTPEERQAMQAIQNELDPDRAIQMVNDFEKKFPASMGLPFTYLKAAIIYRQKGDVQRVIEYGEKSLKLNGDNPGTLLLMASVLPEPQSLRGNDLDKEKKLSEAEEYAGHAMKVVAQLTKQPNETDEQLQKRKAALTSWAHSSLGMVHLQRSSMALTGVDSDELAKAQQEYKTAVSLIDNPDPGDYFRLGEAYERNGKTDEAIGAFSKAAELDPSGRIKPLVDQAIERLKKGKPESKPETKPPAKP